MLKPTSTPLPKLPWKDIKVTRIKLIMLMNPSPPNHIIMLTMLRIRSMKALPLTQDLQEKNIGDTFPYLELRDNVSSYVSKVDSDDQKVACLDLKLDQKVKYLDSKLDLILNSLS